MDIFAKGWRWALGDLPRSHAPPDGAGFWVLLAFAGLAMGLGDSYGLKGANPIQTGAWRMAAHGGPCLAAVAALAPGPVVARAGAVIVALLPAVWRIGSPTSLQAHPEGLIALMALAAIATRIAVGAGAWRDAGLGVGDWRWWLPRAAIGVFVVFVSVAIAVYLSPSMQKYYPSYKPARTDSWELTKAMFGVGLDFIGWELMFRGVLNQLVARRGDPRLALGFGAVPFFLLHSGKPPPEFWSSLPGGVIAAWFCLRAGTFLPLWLLHLVMYTTASVTAFWLR